MTRASEGGRSLAIARLRAALLCAAALAGCTMDPAAEHAGESTALLRAAGDATVFDATRAAFSLPVPTLGERHRTQFFVGNSFFNLNWVSAPSSVDSRDGLGPLFNARSCSTCHFKDGRGRPPDAGQALESILLRISVPGQSDHGAPLPDPTYGTQIQGDALPGIPREAHVDVRYEELSGTFRDGTPYRLRTPRYALLEPGYGPFSEVLLISARVAPQMVGLGLLEAVPESDVRARADAADEDGDSISGRANEVWDVAQQRVALGRFGWKAEQPSVRQQTAGAFAGDLGITSTLFASENHTSAQQACSQAASGGRPELSEDILAAVTLYASALAVPARRNVSEPSVQRGESLFARAHCDSCHTPTLHTREVAVLPELSHQELHPYTDLLLHDLGEGLADGRPSFAASGREWRTPPLWGIGLIEQVNGHTYLLHDGRARDLTEAILWHAGEALSARAAFLAMTSAERSDLISFLGSL